MIFRFRRVVQAFVLTRLLGDEVIVVPLTTAVHESGAAPGSCVVIIPVDHGPAVPRIGRLEAGFGCQGGNVMLGYMYLGNKVHPFMWHW